MASRILWAIPISMLYTEDARRFPAVQMVLRALDLLKAGNLGEAEQLMQKALEVAHRGHHSVSEGIAALGLSNLYWGTGRALLACDLARRARHVFRQQANHDQRHNEAVAAFNLGLVHHLIGDHFEALNEYQAAQQLLDTARQHWVKHNKGKQVSQCDQLEKWIKHLTDRLITSAPLQRNLTLFLPVSFANGATATLWGEYARDASVILGERTLRAVPLQEWLVLTADCCVFPIPPQVWQEVHLPSGQTGDYALVQPGDSLPDSPFGISGDFIRLSNGRVIPTGKSHRIIGGGNYRPIALLI